MTVVTIRGQMGSGAIEIGKAVARLMPGEYVDRHILEGIAQLAGHPADRVADIEQTTSRLAQRIKAAIEKAFKKSDDLDRAVSHISPASLEDAEYLDALKSVIQELALEENIVIHGRGSQFILHNNPSALHVLVIAPLPVRVNRVMVALNVEEYNARKQIEEYDNSRRAFIKRFFQRDIEDPEYYDLVVNTGRLTYDVAVQSIIRTAQRKSPWGHA